MLASPAKRRRTSSTTAVPVNASSAHHDTTDGAVKDATGASTRASFQSPTKSSLARSHPQLLPVPKQPQSQATQAATKTSDNRRQSLVHQVLGNKRRSSALIEHVSQSANSAPQTPLPNPEQETQSIAVPNSVAAPESLSAAISRAFVESRPVSSRRSPLRPIQASGEPNASSVGQETIDGQKDDGNAAATRSRQSGNIHPVPGLQQKRSPNSPVEDFFDTGPSSDDAGEPELPPTPTQLGISPHPDKPRGLALSSSPSGRRARRAAKEAAEGHPFRSSPLKTQAEGEPPSELEHGEALESGTIEAAEIVAAQRRVVDDDAAQDDQELARKLNVKKSLTSQLLRLQAELKQIESFATTSENEPEDLSVDEGIISLLTTDNPSCLPPFAATNAKLDNEPGPPDLLAASDDEALQYLNLFAPGNLDLSTTSSTAVASDSSRDIVQSHKIILTSPFPFPAHAFTLHLSVETNITRQEVLKIELLPSSNLKGHEGLRNWITSRLTSSDDRIESLHSQDVGTIVWGAGMWWDSVLERARIWSSLDTQDSVRKQEYKEEDKESVVPQDLKILLPHLTRSSMIFYNSTRDRKLDTNTKALHLSYNPTLDWTGDPTPEIHISATGLPSSTSLSTEKTGNSNGGNNTSIKKRPLNGEQSLKQIFDKLRKQHGIVEAVKGIKGIVFGHQSDDT